MEKCGCETLGLQSVMADLGIQTTCVMKTGSTAAKGMTNRIGHGKVKHLQTCELWLQDVVREEKRNTESRNKGQSIRPDDETPGQKKAAEHMKRLSARTATGWHKLAPTL